MLANRQNATGTVTGKAESSGSLTDLLSIPRIEMSFLGKFQMTGCARFTGTVYETRVRKYPYRYCLSRV